MKITIINWSEYHYLNCDAVQDGNSYSMVDSETSLSFTVDLYQIFLQFYIGTVLLYCTVLHYIFHNICTSARIKIFLNMLTLKLHITDVHFLQLCTHMLYSVAIPKHCINYCLGTVSLRNRFSSRE